MLKKPEKLKHPYGGAMTDMHYAEWEVYHEQEIKRVWKSAHEQYRFDLAMEKKALEDDVAKLKKELIDKNERNHAWADQIIGLEKRLAECEKIKRHNHGLACKYQDKIVALEDELKEAHDSYDRLAKDFAKDDQEIKALEDALEQSHIEQSLVAKTQGFIDEIVELKERLRRTGKLKMTKTINKGESK